MKLSFAIRFSIVYLFILLNYTPHSFGQKSVEQKLEKLKSITDQAYGLDDVLINGEVYRPILANTDKHPYFSSNSWHLGNIKIHGKQYKDLILKYNLDLDKVIIRSVLPSGTFMQTVLHTRFIDEFSIENHRFIRASKLSVDLNLKGFVEIVTLENPGFFIKHKKAFRETKELFESGTKAAFYERKPQYFLVHNGQSHKLSNRKAFIKYFEHNEGELRQYFKRNDIDYNKANIAELKLLIDYCKQFLIPQDE